MEDSVNVYLSNGRPEDIWDTWNLIKELKILEVNEVIVGKCLKYSERVHQKLIDKDIELHKNLKEKLRNLEYNFDENLY